MSAGLAVLGVLATLLFPGAGQGLGGRRTWMIVFTAAAVIATVAILASVWALPVALGLRLVAAVDAWLGMRRGDRARKPNWRLMAISVVIGAFGFGTAGEFLQGFKIPSSSMYPTLVIGDHVFVERLTMKWRPPARGEVLVFTQPCAQRTYIKRVIAVPGDTVEVRCSVVYVNGTALPTSLVDARAGYLDQVEMDGRWIPRTASRYRESHGGHTYDTFSDEGRPDRGTVEGDSHDFPRRERAMFPPSCVQGEFYEPDPRMAKQPAGTIVETKAESVATPCEPQLHFVVPKGGFFVMGDNRNNANDSRYWGVVPDELVIGRPIGIYMSSGAEGSWKRFGSLE